MKNLIIIIFILLSFDSIAQETLINLSRKELIENLRNRGNQYVTEVDNEGNEVILEAYDKQNIHAVVYFLKNNSVILQENTYDITLLPTMLKEMNTHLNYIKESIWHNKEQTLGFKVVVKREEKIFELTIIKI
jgi:hypothetical protein